MTASVSPPLIAVRRAVAVAALTAWTGASLQGGTSADDVCDAAALAGLRQIRTAQEATGPILVLARLRAEGYTSARLVLPAPGDIAGLPGPAPVNVKALAAGAAIVLTVREPTDADAFVLLPADDGEWPVHRVPLSAVVVSSWHSMRQARGEFAAGVAGHSEALAELDVAGDARGLRRLVDGEDEQPLPALPPGLPDDRRELLGRARLVAVLAAAAAQDDGAAVSAAEASSRAAHLRSLGAIARRAIAASVSGP